jgi:hypothetical protein
MKNKVIGLKEASKLKSSYTAYRHYLLDGNGNRDGVILKYTKPHLAEVKFPQGVKEVLVSPNDLVEIEEC